MTEKIVPTAQEIADFCKDCSEKDKVDGICKKISDGIAVIGKWGNPLKGFVTDQQRYVAREKCNYARQGDIRGQMTKTGFIPTSY